MAHMIGMSVVTEGVETEEQKENLIALGDNFAQGYYFYRPMPKESFEELIRDPSGVMEGYRKNRFSSAGQLHFRDMIQKGLVSETLLNNIIRAAAVYKRQGESVTIVQANEAYSAMTGIKVGEATRPFEDFLEEHELMRFIELLDKADAHTLGGSEGTLRFIRDTGEAIELNMRVFLLYSLDDHRIYLSTMG